ncbi:MAG: Flp pilus assembly complex ATPase component TadA, partial [Kiritimatiellae bacterium]|nr:Flp pilus assembly complex ATPase component TadA [Kiritimatiellia bacterium]
MMGGSDKRAWWEGIAEGMSDPALVEGIPVEWLRRAGVVPLRKGDGGVAIAGAPGTDDQVYEDLTALLGVEAEWVEADAGEIRRAIDRSYFKRTGPAEGEGEAADGEREAEGDWGAGAADLLAGGDDSPVVRYVNGMLLEAVKRGASDIHIEPFAGHVDVRYRIDGTLYARPSPPARMAEAIAARVKVMARLNLAEKRLPQDGATRLRVGTEELDVRVSCVPVAEGERIVLRLLHREATRYSLTGLGMGEELLGRFREVLTAPHGIVLVTGPTGSGKTTTLYAALRELDTAHRNVMTIEDPVEYQLEGIGQMQVHPQIGLTFSSGLRHILRQDPDVILVGETRDLETAEIVVRASLTGHLVFTTLHTNDAVGAVSRLTDMGVPPYLLAAAARAVLAQRLVRKVCPKCGRK